MARKDGDDSFEHLNIEELGKDYKNKLQEACSSQNLDKLHKVLYEDLDSYKTCDVHIAITGETGAGKSSLINTLRNMKKRDPGYAKTGGIAETTMEPGVYEHPNHANVKFLDLPGIGTENFPKDEYFDIINGFLQPRNLSFENCDAFILLTKDRFKEADVLLCQKVLVELKKPLFFVRGNMDTTCQNQERDEEWDEQTTMSETRKACLGALQKILSKGGIIRDMSEFLFLISNVRNNTMDFGKLSTKLMNSFTGLQQIAFLNATASVSQDIINKKYEHLYSRLRKLAMAAALFGGIPFVGAASLVTDSALVMRECNIQRTCFGLDDASLEVYSKQYGIKIADLNTVWSCHFSSAKTTASLFASESLEQAANASLVFSPIGAIIGALGSGYFTYTEMNSHLGECKKAAEQLMTMTLELSQKNLKGLQ